MQDMFDDQSTGAVYGRPRDDIPLNRPVIREWELTSNSTHYDKLVAAPSDETLVKFWTGWATIMFFTAVLTTVLLIPLIHSPKIRANPFHYYLIFLMIPDSLVAWICGSTCLSNALAGMFTTEFMCKFQSFYMIAYIGANGWLNASVARHLYLMLSAAKHFRRYAPPTHRRVLWEVAIIYAYSLGLGMLGLLDAPWWPHKTKLTIGSACIPMDYDTASTVFFYCVIFPLLFGGPLAYVLWAGYQIWKHELLPPSGRRRILAVYFFRLGAVFLIMWLPGLLLLFVTGAWVDPWLAWAGGSWSHLQGTVSALVSLWKPDIWMAVRDFWTCGKFASKSPARQTGQPPTPSTASRRSVTFSRAKSVSFWGKSSLRWSGNFVIPWSSHVPESQLQESDGGSSFLGSRHGAQPQNDYANDPNYDAPNHYAVDPDDDQFDSGMLSLSLDKVEEGDDEDPSDGIDPFGGDALEESAGEGMTISMVEQFYNQENHPPQQMEDEEQGKKNSTVDLSESDMTVPSISRTSKQQEGEKQDTIINHDNAASPQESLPHKDATTDGTTTTNTDAGAISDVLRRISREKESQR